MHPSKSLIVPVCLLCFSVWLSTDPTPSVSAEAEPTPTPSPYSALLDTEIRGLSPELIEAYRTGAGAGSALPAELNGYPGPRHVLDLAAQLHLTEEQQAEIQTLYDTMLLEAVDLGEQILQAEAELELTFRDNSMDEAFLEEQLAEIGALQAKLRFVHLRTHIATTTILTPEQTEQYSVLRGYTPEGTGHHGSH
jgi:Spy/CpxP family protein refolding chaperone